MNFFTSELYFVLENHCRSYIYQQDFLDQCQEICGV